MFINLALVNWIIKQKKALSPLPLLIRELVQFSPTLGEEIRSLVNLKPTKSSSIKILDENEIITSDSKKIANIFNEHYATLGSKVQQKIPTQDGDYNFYLDRRDQNGKRYINPDGCTFYLSPVGPAEVEKIIDGINVKKSTGPFGIPVFFWKNSRFFSPNG